MEDTQCFVDHYCYSTTIALPASSFQLVQDWVSKYHMTYYCLVHEKAPKTGKLHFQGIIWFGEKPTHKRERAMREWWNGKLDKNIYHPFSLTKCYSTCEELARYCLKEFSVSEATVTNLSPDMLKRLRMFKTKKERTQHKKEQLERKVKEYIDKEKPAFSGFCYAYMDIYNTIYQTYPRHRIQYYIAGVKYGILSKGQFLTSIGVNMYPRDPVYPSYDKLLNENRQLRSDNSNGHQHTFKLNQQIKNLKEHLNTYKPSQNHKIDSRQQQVEYLLDANHGI